MLSIGRLSRQKNQELIIRNFKRKEFKDYNLVILGEGELEKDLKSLVKKLSLEKKNFFEGYNKNIYKFINIANCVIVSSLWEDPGWVMIEAAGCNTTVVSSDCNYGPKEFICDNKGGFLFKSNSDKSFISAINEFINTNQEHSF